MEFKTEVSAGGIVIKEEGDNILWLVTQHSQHKGWGFPKGLIGDKEKGESVEKAALREVGEEGGVKAKIISKIPEPTKYSYRFKNILVKKTVWYFLMKYLSGNPEDHDWEVSEARFLTEDEVRKILTFKSDQQAFSQALQIFKQAFNNPK